MILIMSVPLMGSHQWQLRAFVPLIVGVSFILDEIHLVIGHGKEYPLLCFLHSRLSSFLVLEVTPDTGAECGNSIALSALAAVPPLYKLRGLGGIMPQAPGKGFRRSSIFRSGWEQCICSRYPGSICHVLLCSRSSSLSLRY